MLVVMICLNCKGLTRSSWCNELDGPNGNCTLWELMLPCSVRGVRTGVTPEPVFAVHQQCIHSLICIAHHLPCACDWNCASPSSISWACLHAFLCIPLPLGLQILWQIRHMR